MEENYRIYYKLSSNKLLEKSRFNDSIFFFFAGAKYIKNILHFLIRIYIIVVFPKTIPQSKKKYCTKRERKVTQDRVTSHQKNVTKIVNIYTTPSVIKGPPNNINKNWY